jgi:hypothetical protein
MTSTTDISSLTKAVEDILNNTQDFDQVTVCRGEPINDDPNMCPWVGIYRREQSLMPRTLGMGQGHRRDQVRLVIAVQDTSLADGGDCEDRVDKLVKDTVDAILGDATIGGLVDMTNEILVAYEYDALFPPQMNKEEGYMHYFQTAYVQLTMEGRTS